MPILDHKTKWILGWMVSKRRNTSLALDALDRAQENPIEVETASSGGPSITTEIRCTLDTDAYKPVYAFVKILVHRLVGQHDLSSVTVSRIASGGTPRQPSSRLSWKISE
jgi:hypothetical protein